MFSPATIESDGNIVQGMALAPLAVLPEYQRQGIGSRLVQEGLRMLQSLSCSFVIVLGHPDYYHRFGFGSASKHSVRSEWKGVPDEAFMILTFDKFSTQGLSGVARYRNEFEEAMQ